MDAVRESSALRKLEGVANTLKINTIPVFDSLALCLGLNISHACRVAVYYWGYPPSIFGDRVRAAFGRLCFSP